MLKHEERDITKSCWNKALDNERVFTLMARDKTAPEVIRFWCQQRVKLGINNQNDVQIQEALLCADFMEEERDQIRKSIADIE